MNKESQSNIRVGCIGAAAIIVAAIIGWGVPFAKNIADRLLPPFTPTLSFNPPMQIATVGASPLPVNQPTLTIMPNVPQPSAFPTLCYGQCWQYNNNLRTMTWTGLTDGTEDIWQPSGDPLQKIRSGYTAIITTSVPGEIFSCVLVINGQNVKNSCDGVLYQISPGTYQITSANSSVGGFRWCPLIGYGWRINGGECK